MLNGAIRRTVVLPAAAAAMIACGRGGQKPANQAASKPQFPSELDIAARGITSDYLRDQIAKLSSDEFEGRGPATAGDKRTRAYLIEQLKTLGYQPGGEGRQWEQPFDIVGITARMPKQWVF